MPDAEFILLGDACWLDFVNTARGPTADPTDRLPDPAAYHRWTRAQKLVSDANVVAFADILLLRRQLGALADALSAGRQAPAASVAAVNALLARHSGHEQLIRTAGRWSVRLAPERQLPALAIVARSVAVTLADATRAVRRCAADPCSLVFLDSATSQTRPWCSAAVCGGRGRIERRRGMLR